MVEEVVGGVNETAAVVEEVVPGLGGKCWFLAAAAAAALSMATE
jgi:hypothetical protein